MLGSAIAVSISDIPFDGPTATTQVGLIDGEFVSIPHPAQKKVSDLALTVASTREKVIMIEAGANEVPEDKMIEAIFAAHAVNQDIIKFIDTIVAECGKAEARAMSSCDRSREERFADDMTARPFRRRRDGELPYLPMYKQVREEKISAESDRASLEQARYAEERSGVAARDRRRALPVSEEDLARKTILKDHKRPDGRANTTRFVRWQQRLNMLPRVHGSGMFTPRTDSDPQRLHPGTAYPSAQTPGRPG